MKSATNVSWGLLAIALLAAPLEVSADERADYDIASIDVRTGRVIWATEGQTLPLPLLTLRGQTVCVYDAEFTSDLQVPVGSSTCYSKKDGRRLACGATEAPSELQNGGRLLISPDGLRPLEPRSAMPTFPRLGIPAEDQPSHFGTATNGRIIFAFENRFFGEAYAYDSERLLIWTYRAWRATRLPESGRQRILLENGAAYYLAEPSVQMLETASGTAVWRQSLPTDREYQGAGAELFLDTGVSVLLVRVSQFLFGLDSRTGALLWGYDNDQKDATYPVIDPESHQVVLGFRGAKLRSLELKEPISLARQVGTGRKIHDIAAISIPAGGCRSDNDRHAFSVRTLSVRDVPKTSEVVWSLNKPISTRENRPLVRISTLNFDQEDAFVYSVSDAPGEAYIGLPYLSKYIEVRCGAQVVHRTKLN